jgi:hypothetical protein
LSDVESTDDEPDDPEESVAGGVLGDVFDVEPDVPEEASVVVAVASEGGLAQAVAGVNATADPMPNATANAPTRPTYFA